MRKILVASTNPGKLKELREMLGGDIEWVGLSDFPGVSEIEEDGKTFAENARKKAVGYAKATGLWTLADDSGLVVDALNGQPGVKSARFSGVKEANRGLIDHKNMAKVLTLLKGVFLSQDTEERAFLEGMLLAEDQAHRHLREVFLATWNQGTPAKLRRRFRMYCGQP